MRQYEAIGNNPRAGNPAALRYPRSACPGVPLDPELQLNPAGKGEALREGQDLTLIGVITTVSTCLKAAAELHRLNIEATVINLRFIKPLDRDLILRSARANKRIITVEDHILAGGMGSAILELLQEEGLTEVTVERIGFQEFAGQGTIPELHEAHGLTVKGIWEAVRRLNIPLSANSGG